MISPETASPPRSEKPSADEARARQREMQAKIHAVSLALLDKLQETVAGVAQPDPPPAASKIARRRMIANLLATHMICPRASCRRRRACLGEPVECLSSGLPHVSPEMIEMLVARRKRPRRK